MLEFCFGINLTGKFDQNPLFVKLFSHILKVFINVHVFVLKYVLFINVCRRNVICLSKQLVLLKNFDSSVTNRVDLRCIIDVCAIDFKQFCHAFVKVFLVRIMHGNLKCKERKANVMNRVFNVLHTYWSFFVF